MLKKTDANRYIPKVLHEILKLIGSQDKKNIFDLPESMMYEWSISFRELQKQLKP